MGLLALLPVVGELLERVIPDPNKRMELQIQLAQIADQEAARESQERIQQMQTNTAEAANPNGNMFTAGWRPAVGWICAVGVGYSFILQPLASWIAVLGGFKGTFPNVGTYDLMVLLTGMLGLSASRTYEKKIGVADSTAIAQAAESSPKPAKKKILGIDWPF